MRLWCPQKLPQTHGMATATQAPRGKSDNLHHFNVARSLKESLRQGFVDQLGKLSTLFPPEDSRPWLPTLRHVDI